jgi:hypothetical protein
MIGRIVIALACGIALSVPGIAQARTTFTVGDNVYADGQWFTVDEYEQYKATHPAGAGAIPAAATRSQTEQPQYQAPVTTAAVGGPPVVTVAPPPVSAPLATPLQNAAVAAPALRAASCKTTRSYTEFPGETDKFDCGPIGQLTRQEMLSQGWKIDFIEKLPAAAGQPAGAYKIILSR